VYSPPGIFLNNLFLPILNGLKLIRGTLGLQNAIPEWEEKFDGTGKFTACLLPAGPDTASIMVSMIRFGTVTGIDQFYKNIRLTPDSLSHVAFATEGRKTKCVVENSEREVYYIESGAGAVKVMEIVSVLTGRR
jgi:hypothetical protein